MAYTLAELADRVGGQVLGDAGTVISGVGTLSHAEPGDITFLTNRRYRAQMRETRASAVIVGAADAEHCPVSGIIADNPHVAYARVAALFERNEAGQSGIHESAVVDPSARVDKTAWVGPCAVIGKEVSIGPNVRVGPGCYVGDRSTIGADSRLIANVTVYHETVIGERVVIHGGAVIGSDGFGFANEKGRWIKVPQLGRAVIGNDVEIGANTAVDRGAIEDTVIEDGVKLDNLIQVAHNVHIGENTVMAGCVGIAGSASIGKNCAIGGGVGIGGHLEIADRTTITGMSMVTKTLSEPGVYSSGTSVEPNDRWHKNAVRFKQLDEMARRLRALEREIESIRKKG